MDGNLIRIATFVIAIFLYALGIYNPDESGFDWALKIITYHVIITNMYYSLVVGFEKNYLYKDHFVFRIFPNTRNEIIWKEVLNFSLLKEVLLLFVLSHVYIYLSFSGSLSHLGKIFIFHILLQLQYIFAVVLIVFLKNFGKKKQSIREYTSLFSTISMFVGFYQADLITSNPPLFIHFFPNNTLFLIGFNEAYPFPFITSLLIPVLTFGLIYFLIKITHKRWIA